MASTMFALVSFALMIGIGAEHLSITRAGLTVIKSGKKVSAGPPMNQTVEGKERVTSGSNAIHLQQTTAGELSTGYPLMHRNIKKKVEQVENFTSGSGGVLLEENTSAELSTGNTKARPLMRREVKLHSQGAGTVTFDSDGILWHQQSKEGVPASDEPPQLMRREVNPKIEEATRMENTYTVTSGSSGILSQHTGAAELSLGSAEAGKALEIKGLEVKRRLGKGGSLLDNDAREGSRMVPEASTQTINGCAWSANGQNGLNVGPNGNGAFSIPNYGDQVQGQEEWTNPAWQPPLSVREAWWGIKSTTSTTPEAYSFLEGPNRQREAWWGIQSTTSTTTVGQDFSFFVQMSIRTADLLNKSTRQARTLSDLLDKVDGKRSNLGCLGKLVDGQPFKDMYGEGCSWYENQVALCGDFDHGEHIAGIHCCECAGGDASDFQCIDSDDGAATDTGSDSCAWYNGLADCPQVPNAAADCVCGNYDDDDFTAMSMCCNCGGGTDYCIDLDGTDYCTDGCQDSQGKGCADYHFHRGTGECEDEYQLGTVDNSSDITDCAGDTCDWYATHPNYCQARFDIGGRGLIPHQHCCDCGGGTFHHHSQMCGQLDTATFKALEMCCGCGGGKAKNGLGG